MIGRRGFLLGMGAAVAAPALVHASNLMPLRGSPLVIPPSGTHLTMQFRDEVGRCIMAAPAYASVAHNGSMDIRCTIPTPLFVHSAHVCDDKGHDVISWWGGELYRYGNTGDFINISARVSFR